MKKLTAKEEAICQSFLILNEKVAAFKEVYKCDKSTDKTIKNDAYKVFKRPHVMARVVELKKERNERTGIDADYVLNRLVEIDEMDVLDILEDNGTVKALSKWPKCWRTLISGLDVSEIMSDDNLVCLKKIKWPDKVKNLELIGKHVDVQAFKDKVEHSGTITHEEALNELS